MRRAATNQTPARACPLCGTDISDRRKGIRWCSDSHRAEGSRLSRLLRGESVDGHRSLRAYLDARQKRTSAPTGGL